MSRDTSFYTKDACEELVKPLLQSRRTSLVQALAEGLTEEEEQGPELQQPGLACRLWQPCM